MFFVHLSALLGILVFIFCLRKLGGTPKKLPEYSLTILILAALFVRILCAGLSKGFDTYLPPTIIYWAARCQPPGRGLDTGEPPRYNRR